MTTTTHSPSDTDRDDLTGRLDLVRHVAAGLAAITAALYFLIGAGVLWIGTAVDGAAEPDLFAFGALVGGVFLAAAVLLWREASRALWAGVAVLQVIVLVGYVAVAGQRDPAYEQWGLLIKALQVALLAATGWLLLATRGPGTFAGADEPADR